LAVEFRAMISQCWSPIRFCRNTTNNS